MGGDGSDEGECVGEFQAVWEGYRLCGGGTGCVGGVQAVWEGHRLCGKGERKIWERSRLWKSAAELQAV